MSAKLLIEHHLEFLSLTGGYTGWSESTLVKIPHCWKSHVTAHIILSSGGAINGNLIYVPIEITKLCILRLYNMYCYLQVNCTCKHSTALLY